MVDPRPVAFWDVATISVMKQIFQNLSFTDLKNCRLVTKVWNNLITTTLFDSAILYVSLAPNSQNVLQFSTVRWNYIRFHLFEIHRYPDFLWCQSTTPLAHLKILEFKQCFICWKFFKRLIISAMNLRQLIFRRSIFDIVEHHSSSDASTTSDVTEQNHDEFLLRMSHLDSLTITEVGELSGMSEILDRMLLYPASSLVTLRIEFKTTQHVRTSEAVRMLQVLSELILLNKMTLRNLIVNLWNTELLNNFLPFVVMPLEQYAQSFQLRVFKLATPSPDRETTSVTLESSRLMFHLGDFLRTQRYLQSLAFPHLSNLGAAESRRWSILDQTTKHLVKLRVPGVMYLRRNMFKSFRNLKLLVIGEKHLGNSATFLQPTKFNVDRGGFAKRNIAKIRILSTHANIIYETGNLFHILEKFPNLTTFEFNALRPLFNDKDIQAVIKHLSKLRHLSISYCDLITDTGITGIPLETCQDMLQYSTIYIDDIDVTKKLSLVGSPLSNLRNLVTLHLVGKAQVSDVGIKFGMEFRDLKKLQLPSGKMITSWGIVQLGKQNACLESLIFSRASEETAIGLTIMATTHDRLVKNQCKVQTLCKVDSQMLEPTLIHGILSSDSD